MHFNIFLLIFCATVSIISVAPYKVAAAWQWLFHEHFHSQIQFQLFRLRSMAVRPICFTWKIIYLHFHYFLVCEQFQRMQICYISGEISLQECAPNSLKTIVRRFLCSQGRKENKKYIPNRIPKRNTNSANASTCSGTKLIIPLRTHSWNHEFEPVVFFFLIVQVDIRYV